MRVADREIVWCIESPGFGGAERDLLRVIDMVADSYPRHIVAHGLPLAADLAAGLERRGVEAAPFTGGSKVASLRGAWSSASALLARFPGAVWIVWCHHFDACRWLQQRLAWSGRAFAIAERSMAWDERAFERSRLTRPLKRVAAHRARRVIVPGAGQADFYPELFRLARDRVGFVPNSRPVRAIAERVAVLRRSRAALRRERGLPEDAFVVLCVGRLDEHKGQELLVEAAAIARRSVPRVHLCLVGSGSQQDRLAALAARLLPDAHTIAGERSDVDEYLAAADGFGLATRFEGLSGALLEAMAAGVPILASDIPANRELVIHEQTGLLCPLDDAPRWAAAVVRAAADPAAAAKWADAASARVLERYDERVEREGWLKVIGELVS